MSNRSSAARYAKALFDVASKEGGLEPIDAELASFTRLVETNDELRKVLLNPVVPITAKRGIVEKLMQGSTLPAPLAKLLLLLADRDRLELLPDLAAAYHERLMEHQNVVSAEVVTAMPLDDKHAAQLQRRLADATGRTVTVKTRVDPEIIGGVVAKIGSTVYDGSVATQLARMRQKLAESM